MPSSKPLWRRLAFSMEVWLLVSILVFLTVYTKDRDTVEYTTEDLACVVRPPQPFQSDGCSMFPDGNWVECCIVHDKAYWCGGTSKERREADKALAHCVSEIQNPALGWTMFLGVQAGGVSFLPTPFRWGYGWYFPQAGPDVIRFEPSDGNKAGGEQGDHELCDGSVHDDPPLYCPASG